MCGTAIRVLVQFIVDYRPYVKQNFLTKHIHKVFTNLMNTEDCIEYNKNTVAKCSQEYRLHNENFKICIQYNVNMNTEYEYPMSAASIQF